MNSLNKDLFVTFMKIGGFTLGGGAAMIPLMEQQVVTQHQWLTHSEFMDVMAVSQATPGVFAVNMASHIGYKVGGIRSGIIASLGVVFPSLVIILLIAIIFSRFRDNRWVEAAFMGIRPAVVALLAVPVFKMGKTARVTWSNVWIPILSTALIIYGVTTELIILVAGVAGFLYGLTRKEKQQS
ncbi:MAG: chromate transporter [Bacteroidales bacterium]|nr:chromate transporter [Bacteroidales bacterium]